MKIEVIENEKVNEIKVTILCKRKTDFVTNIVKKLSSIDISINAKLNDSYIKIKLDEIYYIDTVDNRTYVYCEKEIFENNMKIYELEKMLEGTSIVRVNKSCLLNIDKLRSVKAQINGRLLATLSNNEKIIINRSYVKEIKRRVKIKYS